MFPCLSTLFGGGNGIGEILARQAPWSLPEEEGSDESADPAALHRALQTVIEKLEELPEPENRENFSAIAETLRCFAHELPGDPVSIQSWPRLRELSDVLKALEQDLDNPSLTKGIATSLLCSPKNSVLRLQEEVEAIRKFDVSTCSAASPLYFGTVTGPYKNVLAVCNRALPRIQEILLEEFISELEEMGFDVKRNDTQRVLEISKNGSPLGCFPIPQYVALEIPEGAPQPRREHSSVCC